MADAAELRRDDELRDFGVDPGRHPPSREKFAALAAWALGVIGFVGLGVFALDDWRKVLSVNSVAVSLLGEGLAIRGERLVALDRTSDGQLTALIGLAAAADARAGVLGSVAIRRPSKLPLVARTMWIEATIQPAFDGATRLLIVSDPELRAAPPADLVYQLFELTPMELQVAIAIARGNKLAGIAADEGIKVGTVRSHLKSVFAKTNTRSQAELAALLARLAV